MENSEFNIHDGTLYGKVPVVKNLIHIKYEENVTARNEIVISSVRISDFPEVGKLASLVTCATK